MQTSRPLLSPAVARSWADEAVAGHAYAVLGALDRARTGCSPYRLATAEDAVFRFYLPMARSLAAEGVAPPDDPEAAIEAAELGLARAVLDWQGSDVRAFEGFARAMIKAHLRSLPGAHTLA